MLPKFCGIQFFCLLFLTIQQASGLECGLVNTRAAPWSSTTGYTRTRRMIIGGRKPEKNEMPWVVALYRSEKYWCTGSLIAPNYVLTAKHCFQDLPRPIKGVSVGYGSVNKMQMQKTKVVNIFDHDEADISVLELEDSVYRTPVCLPEDYNSECELDNNMVVAGLGTHIRSDYKPIGLEDGEIFRPRGEFPNSVYWTNIKQLETAGCTDLINPEAEFCAGGLRRGVLPGDSGGPVMKVEENSVVQIGVTSRGIVFAVNQKTFQYAVFVNVGYISAWIYEKTNGTAQFRPVYDPCNSYWQL